MKCRVRLSAVGRLLAVGVSVPLLAAASGRSDALSGSALWKINTHLFAANVALADAINDGMVTIPPFGEFTVPPAVVQALREAPAAYRAGVLAPDLFPDMYFGGWVIHSDLSQSEKWMADDWLRHVWTKARTWPNDSDRNKVLAFGYGFLTHGAGDIFAHTWVNEKADGAWVSFEGKDRSTAFKHIVLEGFVGEHTPPTDLSLDVWPRFVSNTLIKDAVARRHSGIAKHYQRWLAIADGLPKAIDRAKSHMNDNIRNDAPYWAKCVANPGWCARKEHAETWLLDINRGFRAMVDSSESLGEMLMDGSSLDGVGAMTGWATEWVPKMFGAHALGEGTAALSEFMQWASDLVPISEMIKAEVERFVRDSMPKIWNIYQAAQKPSTYMEQPGFFPPGTKAKVSQEMGVRAGGTTFDWRAFEPIYNTVILSKLALLDANGLNELLRRAQVSAPIFPTGPETNVMLGTFRSMTQSYQWVGDTVTTTTKFGICGPETGDLLLKHAVCGVAQRNYSGKITLPAATRPNTGGFVLWGHPEAREKVFRVIFKGFGPGPGTADRVLVAQTTAAIPGLREGRRALRAAADQTEYMREVVAVMQGKVAGIVSAAPNVAPVAAAPVGGRQPAGAAPPPRPTPAGTVQNITDWGTRCCSKDIAELRAGLTVLQGAGRRLQNSALLGQLGRRPSATQIGARAAQMNAALDVFANTRDAATATAALALVSRQLETLAAVVAGTQ